VDFRHLFLDAVDRRIGKDTQFFRFRKIEHARIPARLVRIVDVRDDERHFEPVLEQRSRAADAYVAVTEDDRLGSQEESFSSTACTR